MESHRDSISKEEYTRYSNQLDLMRKIIQEFDQEGEEREGEEEEKLKQERQQRILHLMQQVQRNTQCAI